MYRVEGEESVASHWLAWVYARERAGATGGREGVAKNDWTWRKTTDLALGENPRGQEPAGKGVPTTWAGAGGWVPRDGAGLSPMARCGRIRPLGPLGGCHRVWVKGVVA